MPLYQLSLPSPHQHGGLVYFSEAGLTVVVTHHVLKPKERDAWCRRIVAYNNGSDASLGRRTRKTGAGGGFQGDYSEVYLEFMRYVIVWGADDTPLAAVCMDTLCDIEWSSVTERGLCWRWRRQ